MKWAPGAKEGITVISVYNPMGIHVDNSDNIYVSSRYGSIVYKYTYLNGSYTQTTVAGTGSQGSELNELYYPHGIHVDSAGNVYIADR